MTNNLKPGTLAQIIANDGLIYRAMLTKGFDGTLRWITPQGVRYPYEGIAVDKVLLRHDEDRPEPRKLVLELFEALNGSAILAPRMAGKSTLTSLFEQILKDLDTAKPETEPVRSIDEPKAAGAIIRFKGDDWQRGLDGYWRNELGEAKLWSQMVSEAPITAADVLFRGRPKP